MTYAPLTSDLVSGPKRQTPTKGRKKRRALVLTNEAARHPFRASLPPHVLADLIPIPAERIWDLTRNDIRGFASVYLTATAAILVFIV
jgi:hypothetical protein